MKKVILDTDIGPDCEDAAALAILNILADKGYCEILGVSHCTSNPYGAGTIDVINRYFGRGKLPISTYPQPGFLSGECDMRFNRHITMTFKNRYQTEQPEPAVKMYRRILAAQEDKSVEFIAIGPLVNLSDLLESKADEYSPLDGIALVEKKVNKLSLMAGAFRQKATDVNERAEADARKPLEEVSEWNVEMHIESARNVAANWPTPKVYLGWEIGISVIGGGVMKSSVPENHPVRVAYELYSADGTRYTWDSLLIEHAVVDDNPHFKNSVPGAVRFDEKGRTLWTPDENGQDHFVELAMPVADIVKDFNNLLITPPVGGFPKDFH